MNKNLFILIFFLLFPVCANAQFYKWVDENGVTHFSETPRGDKSGGYKASAGSNEVNEDKSNDVIVSNESWEGCDSELCDKVKQFDPYCRTSDCTLAKKYSTNCTDLYCVSEKMDFEERIERNIRNKKRKDKIQYQNSPEGLAEKRLQREIQEEESQKERDRLLIEDCEKKRDIYCRKGVDFIRKQREWERINKM